MKKSFDLTVSFQTAKYKKAHTRGINSLTEMKILLLITIFAAICLGIEVAAEAEAQFLPAFLRNKQLQAHAKN